MTQINPDEIAYQCILRKMKSVKGLDFSGYRSACLKRRIDTRLRAHQLENYNEYLQFLSKNPQEYDELLNVATINVSEFFRDKEAWQFVEKNIIPALIQQKETKNKRIIRLWSAGCSSGEEAYTLAILFHEILQAKITDFNIKIYGTDIDKDSLKKAKNGCYQSSSIKNIPTGLLKKYFDYDGKQYKVKDEIQALTHFQNKDLILSEPLELIDFVICRNVLIYFTKELQAKIMAKFNSALQPNGYLMLGKTESFGPFMEGYFKSYNSSERIYQKL